MPYRHRGKVRADRALFHPARWHDWDVCRGCGSVVEDWAIHDPCPRTELDRLAAQLAAALDQQGPGRPGGGEAGPQDLARLANEYGEAAGYEGRGADRQRGGGVRETVAEIGAILAQDWAWLCRIGRGPAPLLAPESRPEPRRKRRQNGAGMASVSTANGVVSTATYPG